MAGDAAADGSAAVATELAMVDAGATEATATEQHQGGSNGSVFGGLNDGSGGNVGWGGVGWRGGTIESSGK